MMDDCLEKSYDASGGKSGVTRKPLSIRIFHWATALLFAIAFASSYKAFDFDVDMPIKLRDGLFVVHRVSGILAGLLLIVWFFARVRAMIRSLRVAGSFSGFGMFHVFLGLICFVLPLLPWLARASDGRIAEMYSFWPVFNLVSHPQTTFALKLLYEHKQLAEIVAILLGLHIAGALFHRYVLKDDVLAAMLFRKK